MSVYAELQALWRGKKSPWSQPVCRRCAPDAFPPEAHARYPVDSYHVGSRFQIQRLFGLDWRVLLDWRRPQVPIEARAGEDGWVICEIVKRQHSPTHFETVACPCSPKDAATPAEWLRFGRVVLDVERPPRRAG